MSAVANNNNYGKWDHISQSYSQLRLPRTSEEVVGLYSKTLPTKCCDVHCGAGEVHVHKVFLKCVENVIFLAYSNCNRKQVGKATCSGHLD